MNGQFQCFHQVAVPMMADPVLLAPQKKEISVIGSFLSALVKQNYDGLSFKEPWKNIDMKNGLLFVTCKLLGKAFMDFNASGNVKSDFTEMWFFQSLRHYNGFTSQRTCAFRYYKINISELEAGLKGRDEYDEEVEPLQWPVEMEME